METISHEGLSMNDLDNIDLFCNKCKRKMIVESSMNNSSAFYMCKQCKYRVFVHEALVQKQRKGVKS